MGLHRVRAMLWLHLIRITRYIPGLVNWSVVDGLWISIYVLGAIMFTDPERYVEVAPLLFWAVFAWNLMSTPVWVVGNWSGFYINMGLYEEHEIAGASHSLFLSLRVIPSTIASLITAAVVGYMVYYVTGADVLAVREPLALVLSLASILALSLAYSLLLAYAAIVTQAPAPMLDFMNFILFIIGGVGVPVDSIPEQVRWIAVITPYSHPAEVMRWSITGREPYLGLAGEVLATIAFLAVAWATVYIASVLARRHARLYGVRGIGRT